VPHPALTMMSVAPHQACVDPMLHAPTLGVATPAPASMGTVGTPLLHHAYLTAATAWLCVESMVSASMMVRATHVRVSQGIVSITSAQAVWMWTSVSSNQVFVDLMPPVLIVMAAINASVQKVIPLTHSSSHLAVKMWMNAKMREGAGSMPSVLTVMAVIIVNVSKGSMETPTLDVWTRMSV
jgi:hypothetical protein